MTIRTLPHKSYITPNRSEISNKAEEHDIDTYSVELVEDLANLASGGKMRLPSDYISEIEKSVYKNIPSSDSDGEWQLASGDYTKDVNEYIDDRKKKMINYHQNVCDFLQSVDFRSVPGDSPLEQAMNYLKVLQSQPGADSEEGGANGDCLPIFSNNDNSEKAADKVNDIYDKVSNMDQTEKDLIDPDNNHINEDDEDKVRLAEDMAKGKELILDISRQLDNMKNFKARKIKKPTPNIEGSDVQRRELKYLNEVSRLVSSEWAQKSIYRNYRVVSKVAQVKERIDNNTQKQLLYMLIDVSGSMDNKQKIYKMGGVLMNRLKAVIAGDAELYVTLFDGSIQGEYYVENKEDAKYIMEKMQNYCYDGNDTDIDRAILYAVRRSEEILAEKKLAKPEICIVTDGDDSISIALSDLKNNVLHAFVVECQNQKLIDLAIASKGVGLQNI